ncbi:hypothetical protein NUW54_g12337 [Trametes sanguinea]|uniref:Uncharacterized protein n=1 Tax=Trametes sanguinea TaxID=158606 RepID=A0ACC1N111_9APHY|nr:hypothetical protein NUW54_g12337 [Trametes sanguinea]
MLWPIVAASASPLDERNPLSGLATPTADDTASTGCEGFSSKRRGNFQDEVKRRDGYKCLFTGYFDLTMPDEMRPDNAIVFVPLEAAHIFKRAVAVVDPKESHDKASGYCSSRLPAGFASDAQTVQIDDGYVRHPAPLLQAGPQDPRIIGRTS